MLPVQREVIDNFARKRYRDLVEKARKEAPPTIGTIEAARLLDRREFVYRGRAYSVAPVPWPLAIEVLEVREQMQKKGISNVDLARLMSHAAHLSKRIARPVGFLRRLVWALTPNPWFKATPAQMGKMLGNFSTCLVLDSLDEGEAPHQPDRGTSSPRSRASSTAIPRGLAGMASLSPGRTS